MLLPAAALPRRASRPVAVTSTLGALRALGPCREHTPAHSALSMPGAHACAVRGPPHLVARPSRRQVEMTLAVETTAAKQSTLIELLPVFGELPTFPSGSAMELLKPGSSRVKCAAAPRLVALARAS